MQALIQYTTGQHHLTNLKNLGPATYTKPGGKIGHHDNPLCNRGPEDVARVITCAASWGSLGLRL